MQTPNTKKLKATALRPAAVVANQSTRTASQNKSEIEPLEDRRHLAASHDVAINLNGSSEEAFQKSIPIMKKLGVTSVRVWQGVDDFSKPKMDGGLKRAVQAAAAGFDVMVIVSPDDGRIPSTADVKKWFEWVMDNKSVRDAVDRWEVGNEPDLKHYWQGTLKQYVNGYLKPASEVLRAHGETVVSAGVSWNPNDVKEMIDYGMLNYVDYVGYHPYAKGVTLQKQRIAEFNAIVAGRKPTIASEWNVRGFEKASKSAWADAVESAFLNIKNGFDINYYFVLFTMDSMAGPAGILKTDGSLNQPFYDAFASFSKQLNGGGNNNGGGDPVVGGGNTPSAVSSSLSLFDANTNRVLSGFSSIDSGDIINLADLPTNKLSVVVNASNNAESVKMTLNGKTVVQSGVPYAYFDDNDGDVYAGDLKPGDYTMVITPYSKDGATGTQYTTRTIKFTVVNETGSGSGSSTKGLPEINSFSLINTKTNQVISNYGSITGDIRVDLSALPSQQLSIRINADSDTSSVRLTGTNVNGVENNLPYAMFGDNNGYFNKWTPSLGSYTYNATAYSLDNAKGTKGTTMSFTVTFV